MVAVVVKVANMITTLMATTQRPACGRGKSNEEDVFWKKYGLEFDEKMESASAKTFF